MPATLVATFSVKSRAPLVPLPRVIEAGAFAAGDAIHVERPAS